MFVRNVGVCTFFTGILISFTVNRVICQKKSKTL